MTDRMKLHEAIIFATKAHAGQKRKGTDLDYICHPLEVAQILTEMDPGNDNLIIAGILHDVVEDTGYSLGDVRCHFGDEVAKLVEAHTHPKEGKWIERKMAAVESVKNASPDVKKLVLADKLSNLRSIYSDYQEWGDNLWKRFNAPKAQQRKYYSAMLDAMEELQYYADTRSAYWEATELFKEVFVMYVMKAEKGRIWQVCGDEVYVFKRETLEWEPASRPSNAYAFRVTRFEAEQTEDLWKTLHDTHVFMYGGGGVYLGGHIKDGVLTMTSEVYGDDDGFGSYDSERNYTFSKERTEKLFTIVSVKEFEEIGRKGKVRGMEDFLNRNGIDYGFFTI